MNHYDVIVIGAGHAGVEAALAPARMGCSTLLITANIERVAKAPCNPSVGGPAKGIVTREVDALGGEQGRNTDKTHIQMRLLNVSKGPAVRALRAQIDKEAYPKAMLQTLQSTKNLTLLEGFVEDLVVEDDVVKGVYLQNGTQYTACSVVITSGTYMSSKIIMGSEAYQSGPDNEATSEGLSKSLRKYGFELFRLKTGTPPRVETASIDFSKTERHDADKEQRAFSLDRPAYKSFEEQVPCYLTYTTERTKQLIESNLTQSAMYSGFIEGTGPRYCPSIEDKIVRFNDKERHQIFLEPETYENKETYVQGFSTSMPKELQHEMIHSIIGLEHAKITQYGYAIEYDAIVPTQLWPTLETKKIRGLYSAGQVNGTSGYEEAAGQGILAGINAARHAQGNEGIVLSRANSYIGVLVDDLVTKGTEEPYRLLTSRAEYRLLLRHDNADLRLTRIGYDVGLIDDMRYERFCKKEQEIQSLLEYTIQQRVLPSVFQENVASVFESVQDVALQRSYTLEELIKRPEITQEMVYALDETIASYASDVVEQVIIQIKYEGYIVKAREQVEKFKKIEARKLPESIDYMTIDNLALEARSKLNDIRPLNLGQAMRISGVTPADIAVLTLYLEHIRHHESYDKKEV